MKKIGIIFGGCSSEYQVSLQSAYSIITHINTGIYEPVLIGITRTGEWFHYYGDVNKIKEDTWYLGECNPAMISPDKGVAGMVEFINNSMVITKLDGVFPVLHGKNGEDGTVQGLIALAGIPIIGCGILSSALCMDKDRAHKLVRMEGIDTPEALVFHKGEDIKDIIKASRKLKFPLFVKPVKAGSSFGISKIYEEEMLYEAILNSFQYDDEVIIEENVDGFEVGVAILGNKELIVGEVDEIELTDGFFDFTEKYTLKSSTIHMPARLNNSLKNEIKNIATRIYRTLGCGGFARVDMFITPDARIVFNEVNTIPGFTSHSRYPNMMKGIGLSYHEILDKLIELGLEG